MTRLSLALLLGSLVACGGKSAPPTTSTTSSASADPVAVCRQTFVRQRECTDTFIPALVGLRVRLDVPAGIAAKDKEGGRDALVAAAKAEWAEDSKDAAIAAQCDKMMGAMDAPMKAKLADGASSCLAKTECAAFVECELPIIEQHMSAH